MTRSFTHLHVHSKYSLLDCINSSRELATFAKKDNQTALALTDHGTIAGAIEHYTSCLDVGIKSILGVEAYISTRGISTSKSSDNPTTHLTILAASNEGWKNLIKIITHAHLHGLSYNKPRCDKDFIRAHSKGLIALSGCQSSQLSKAILADNRELSISTIEEFQSIFGKDNFFIELMRINNPRQQLIESHLISLGKSMNLKFVATNDIHWPCKGDEDVHDTLICKQSNSVKKAQNRMRYDTSELYFKPTKDMYSLFSDIEEACTNTLLISEMCNVSLDLKTLRMPTFIDNDGLSAEERFNIEIEKEYLKRYGTDNSNRNRLTYEISVIKKLNFVSYFLIVWDIVNFAKNNNIPVGIGRGSAAGSIVSYCLGITDIDPIKYDLIFERFLSPDRISPPDIDLDICQSRRHEVISYIRSKYGETNVAKIGTIHRLFAKGIVREVGRILDTDKQLIERVSKRIPENPNVTIKGLLKQDTELQNIIKEDPVFARNIAILEGIPTHIGTHAAGIVISDTPIEETIPLTLDKEGNIATQWTMNDVEACGLLKMDILGLKTLSIIDECIGMILANHSTTKDDIKTKSLAYDDPKVYENIFCQSDTLGVFQFESGAMRSYLREMRPISLEDLASMNSLFRPGPIFSGLTESYMRRRNGKEPVEYVDERLIPVLRSTYGLPIFQEQILSLVRTMARWSLAQADILRKCIGKKKVDEMAKLKDKLISDMVINGASQEKATKIFDEIEKFADYTFNASHSFSYSALSYQCAWLKNYYRTEFTAANMNFEGYSDGKMQEWLFECKQYGIRALPPDINMSGIECKPYNKTIRMGLTKIKGITHKTARDIVFNRPKTGYKSVAEVASTLV